MSSSTLALLASSTLVSQGAEAKVYAGILHPALVPASASTSDGRKEQSGERVFLKHRFKKTYRHTALDTQLTKARISAEARSLARCARAGVCVPGVRFVDLATGVLGIEWIDGRSVRALLGGGADEDVEPDTLEHSDAAQDGVTEMGLDAFGATDDEVMTMIGSQLAAMHAVSIIHGDLTTSNMMVRPAPARTPSCEIVLIDFGLAYTSTLDEDKAVDLYVLERALGATHPDGGVRFARILDGYGTAAGPKAWARVNGRLQDVRMRGRKRSMVG